jgi:hypothetical protein
MSIYYYVTRGSGPFEQDGGAILEAEWRSVVSADPDLSLEQPEHSRARNAVWAVWRSYPGGYPAWFALIKGSVEVKGINDSLLTKLRSFATALGARIFCENGEEIRIHDG